MARTVEQLEAEQLSHLPPRFERLRDLLVAYSAVYARVSEVLDELVASTTIEHAEGLFLHLMAHGIGVEPGTDESPTSLRMRMRSIEDAVTRPALIAAADRVLEAHGETTGADMVEWFDEPWLDIVDDEQGGAYLDSTYPSGGPRTFLLRVPYAGDFVLDEFLDDMWLDDPGDDEPPVYAALIAEIERLRAAGIQWRLCLMETP